MNLVPRKNNEVRTRDVFGDFLDLRKEMSDLFSFALDRWPNRGSSLYEGTWNPALDIIDQKDSILVKADLPGLKKEQIDISIHEGVLTIQGEKKEESETKEKGYLRTERFYGSFQRSVVLPSTVDEAKVKASYKDGVLELTLPKKEEAKPKSIKVDVV